MAKTFCAAVSTSFAKCKRLNLKRRKDAFFLNLTVRLKQGRIKPKSEAYQLRERLRRRFLPSTPRYSRPARQR